MIDPLVVAAATCPDRPALEDGTHRWTWRGLLADARALAERLSPVSGDRVGLLSDDIGPAVVAIHAARLAGAVLVPLNRRLTVAECRLLVTRARISRLVVDATHRDMARDIQAATPSLEIVDLPGLLSEPSTAASSSGPSAPLADLLEPPVSGDLPARARPAGGAIVYTSGTTGLPKGVVLGTASLLASARAWNGFLDARPDDVWLATLPLSHVAGLGVVLRAACSHAAVVIADRFDPDAVRQALGRQGVTHVSLVPTQLARLLDSGPITAPTLRGILLGGAPIPVGLVQRALAAGLPVVTTYGLTEAASGVTALPPMEAAGHPGTVGRPLPGMRIRIAVPSGDAGPGEVGEVQMAGPSVCDGYDGDQAATTAAFVDGWLRTGDLGWLDGSGRLTVVGRRDELIISGGENVSPAEVEAVLVSHPWVSDAAVVGRPDVTWGTVPAAIVVPRTDASSLDPAAIRAFARERLAGFKVPAVVVVVPDIPRTASGKVIRREVTRIIATAPSDVYLDRPDGARIHVRRRGAGPAILLLHATLSTAGELDPLADALAARATVIAIDRRSAGASSMPVGDSLGPVDVATHLDDVQAVLDELSVGSAPIVVGHSFGGCVGLELAARYPGSTAGAWLFEPPYLPVLGGEGSGETDALGDRIRRIAEDEGLPSAALAFLETVNGPGVTRRLPAPVLTQVEQEGRSAVADAGLTGLDPTGLAGITAPVVIGLGGRSRGPYEAIAAGLASRIRDLRIEPFPTLGHGGPISQPAVIARSILAFAEGIGHIGPSGAAPGDIP